MPQETEQPNRLPTTTSGERVAIADLADELQVRKQTLFKIARRLGIQKSSRRELERRNQLVSTVAPVDADAIRREIQAARRPEQQGGVAGNGVGTTGFIGVEDGYFYVVQLEPDHDPGRFKVGFTTDVDGRLRKHRCSAPFAVCTKNWPCLRNWERAAIDCLTTGLEQIHTEVFRTNSLEAVIGRGERFFAIMPAVGEHTNGDDDDASLEDGTEDDAIPIPPVR